MPRHRQMPGQSYEILSQDEHCARVEYRWLCPYCERQVSTQSAVYPADYERLEPGASMMRWNAHRVGKPLM